MEQLPLKDIHLPEAVSIWPLAPGWYLLAVLLILSVIAIVLFYKRRKRQSVLRAAAKLLLSIKNAKDQDTLQTLTALSAWLRRVAISIAPRTDVAGLSGSAWLTYLDSSLPDAPFTQGIGACLAESQYRQSVPADIDMDALFKLCERWLKQQKIGKSADRN